MLKNFSIAVSPLRSHLCNRSHGRAAILATILFSGYFSELSGQEVLPMRRLSPAEPIFASPIPAGVSQAGPVYMAPIQNGIVQPSEARFFHAVPGAPNVLVAPSVTAPAKHVGSSAIDLNNLSPDILNCDVCRQRLGLPPKSNHVAGQAAEKSTSNSAPQTIPAPTNAGAQSTRPSVSANTALAEQPVRMLGSPGLISSLTAEQLAKEGLVVEEFKPPQTQPDAIQLSGLPLEVRQQFFKELDLPFGAKVMSANVAKPTLSQEPTEKGADVAKSEPSANNAEPATNTVAAPQTPANEGRSLGSPGIVAANDESEKVSEPLKAPLPPPSKEQVVAPEIAAAKALEEAIEKSVADAIDQSATQQQSLEKQQREFESRLSQMQAEWKERMLQADVANREALSLLERRTAEVSELQSLLQQQKDELAKVKEELGKQSKEAKKSPPATKKETRKKEAGKDRQPTKPTIDT